MRERLAQIDAAARALQASGKRRPRVYFEEWDEPQISAIRWVSELIGIAGGDDIFPELALEPMGKQRIIADPLRDRAARARTSSSAPGVANTFAPEKVAARPGWEAVPAVVNRQLFEIKSADILQPGPAALTDGVEQLHSIVKNWMARHG